MNWQVAGGRISRDMLTDVLQALLNIKTSNKEKGYRTEQIIVPVTVDSRRSFRSQDYEMESATVESSLTFYCLTV